MTISFSKNFRNTIRVSNSLDPDQDRHSVGPVLVPSCLQRLLEDKKLENLIRIMLLLIISFNVF